MAIAVAGAATIAGAWFFQHGLGLRPCPLCLEQRYAYYFAIPLAAMVALGDQAGASRKVLVAALGVDRARDALERRARRLSFRRRSGNGGPGRRTAAVRSTISEPPAACSRSCSTINVVRCDEAPWRFLGLSLAGYNALISLALAAIAGWAVAAEWRARAHWPDHGSSSVSQ